MGDVLDQVVTGEIAAGAPLPTDREIAARYVCDLSVAREAVRALEERGVVDVQTGRGKTVLADERWKLLDRDIAEAALLRHRDRRLLREAVDFFQLVATRTTALAARRLNSGDRDELAQIIEQMRAASHVGSGAANRDEFVEAETAFHRHVIVMSGNRFMASALEALHPVLARVRRLRAADRDASVIALHEDILRALEHRDPTAAAAAIERYCERLASWLRA
jgi:DNA-binding FadR family transcriptional regulator